MEPLISIVMPLYNAERFLEETLISVSKQTFQNYELLCIDDGSDDNTIGIVQRFRDNDSRIYLFRNEKHSGAAVARNRGIKEARGKYLIFFDGDDIFDEDLLALSYQKAEDTKAEIVISELMHVPSELINNKREIDHSAPYRAKFCQQTVSVSDIKICDFMLWSVSPCAKLFQKELIDREHLRFQNLSCENDTYFGIMTFFLAERVVRLDSKKVMVYARDHNTPSRISSDRDPMCVYYAMKKVRGDLEQRGIFNELSQMYYYRTFFFLFDGLSSAKAMEKKKMFYDFLVKEGFDELLGCYNGEQEIDQYIADKKQKFINLGLKEGWEKLNSFYDVFLEDNLQEISGLFQKSDENKKQVGVWGTGHNGKKFLAFCRRHELPVAVVIDSDMSKYGKYCEGYCIQEPQAAMSADIIISTPYAGYETIKKMAETYKADIEVIDLNTYICCY